MSTKETKAKAKPKSRSELMMGSLDMNKQASAKSVNDAYDVKDVLDSVKDAPKEKPYTTLRVKTEMLNRFKKVANENGKDSPTDIIMQVLERWLQAYENGDK